MASIVTTYEELKYLSENRLSEAKTLLENGQFDGANYLAGYCIELALKARICKLLNVDSYPDLRDFKTHDFTSLILLGGLSKTLDSLRNTNSQFNLNWLIVNSWNESLRYSGLKIDSRRKASEFIKAISSEDHGILKWIKSLW